MAIEGRAPHFISHDRAAALSREQIIIPLFMRLMRFLRSCAWLRLCAHTRREYTWLSRLRAMTCRIPRTQGFLSP